MTPNAKELAESLREQAIIADENATDETETETAREGYRGLATDLRLAADRIEGLEKLIDSPLAVETTELRAYVRRLVQLKSILNGTARPEEGK